MKKRYQNKWFCWLFTITMIISNRCRKQHSFRFFTFCCMDNPCGAALRRCAGPAACGGGRPGGAHAALQEVPAACGEKCKWKGEKRMKKVLAILLAACLALSLAACGGSGSSAPVSTAPGLPWAKSSADQAAARWHFPTVRASPRRPYPAPHNLPMYSLKT